MISSEKTSIFAIVGSITYGAPTIVDHKGFMPLCNFSLTTPLSTNKRYVLSFDVMKLVFTTVNKVSAQLVQIIKKSVV